MLFQGLKIPYVLPEKNSNKTLEIGTLYAPEEICYPFKLVLGNCISGIERGADTILITGSCGPCRFGEYCELLMRILRDLGYRNLSFVVADLSPEIGWKEFCGRIEKITSESPVSPFEQLLALQRAYRTVALCDKLDAEACRLAGLERERGQCRRILQAYKERLPLCESPEEALRLLGDTREALDLVELDPEKNPLRVAIIGEILYGYRALFQPVFGREADGIRRVKLSDDVSQLVGKGPCDEAASLQLKKNIPVRR